jgi:hypothetical protein
MTTIDLVEMSFWYLIMSFVLFSILYCSKKYYAPQVRIAVPLEVISKAPSPAYRYEPAGQGLDARSTAMLTTPLRKQPGGTIISSLASPPILHLTNNKHGLMAPLRRKKILICFGCGKKSGIKYDGLIRRWDCTLCDSPNFLDEVSDSTCLSAQPAE